MIRLSSDPAIDAFVRVDNEHVLALVEAVHGAHVDAVHGFATNAALVDDVGQLSVLSSPFGWRRRLAPSPPKPRTGEKAGGARSRERLWRSTSRNSDALCAEEIQSFLDSYCSKHRTLIPPCGGSNPPTPPPQHRAQFPNDIFE